MRTTSNASFTMAEHIAVVSHALPVELFSVEALWRLRALAERLPSCSVAGFECRLARAASSVDFHVFMPATYARLPEPYRNHLSWAPLFRFAEKCIDLESPFGNRLLVFILEFDLNSHTDLVPAPSFFVGLDPRGETNLELVLLVIKELLQPTLLTPLLPELERCFARLPAGAFINQAGAMISRAEPLVRLNIGGLPPSQLPACLEAIRWNGDVERLSSVITEISPSTDFLNLALDLSASGPRSRLGLECFLIRQPADEPRWAVFMEHLVTKGLCAQEKADALPRWPGIDRKETTTATWPAALAVADRFLADLAVSFFVRRINHIKVIFDSGRLCEAKVYLLFGHQWLDWSAFTGN